MGILVVTVKSLDSSVKDIICVGLDSHADNIGIVSNVPFIQEKFSI